MANNLAKLERKYWSDLLGERISFLLNGEYEVFLTPGWKIAVANRLDAQEQRLRGIIMDWQDYSVEDLVKLTNFLFTMPLESRTWENTVEGLENIFRVKNANG